LVSEHLRGDFKDDRWQARLVAGGRGAEFPGLIAERQDDPLPFVGPPALDKRIRLLGR
jgi:hypothetical protein